MQFWAMFPAIAASWTQRQMCCWCPKSDVCVFLGARGIQLDPVRNSVLKRMAPFSFVSFNLVCFVSFSLWAASISPVSGASLKPLLTG